MKRVLPKSNVVFKVLFGAAVFGWMVYNGKLDLLQVAKSLANWPIVLAMLALDYVQVGITAWRWRLLLRAQSIPLPLSRAWGLTMIGMLFNVVIPGSVGGDLIKGYYIARSTPDRKSHAAMSILIDRVVGLIGLLLLGSVMAAVNFKQTMQRPATQDLGMLTVGAFLAGLVGLYAPVLAGSRILEWRLLPKLLQNVFGALHEYRKKASVIPIAIALSVLNQALACGVYYLALLAGGVKHMLVSQFFLIVPLGLVTTAIPISPGGLGVGQAGFFALFRIVAPAYATAGTNAFTVYQVVFILVCVSGLYWYVSYKHPDLRSAAAGENRAAGSGT